MPSTVEQLSSTRVKLTVEIPFSDLKLHLDKSYQEIANQVAIPGFRKGKVPSRVIDQRFGRGAVLQEAINEAIPQAYQAALVEAEVVPMGQPEVDVTRLEDNEVVEFTAEVDVRPNFELPDFSTVEAEVEAVSVSDDDVNERVGLLRRRFATTTEVERAAAEGDVCTIDLVASQDGKELEEATAEGVTYQVGDDAGMLEGLDEALTGLSAGEEKTFTSTLLGGPYQGQEADILVRLSKVAEQELPELDDEFAQLVSEFDTVEEMLADLRQGVESQAKAEQVTNARDKVLEAVIEMVEIEVPEAVRKAEVEGRRNQIEQQLAQQQMTIENYLQQVADEEAETAEEFWQGIEERSVQAIQAQILLDTYADKNQLEVSQQDLTELIFRKAQENGTSPQDEINHMMEHGHLADWTQEVRRSKALVGICSAAKVTDTEGNVVELAPAGAEQPDDEQVIEAVEVEEDVEDVEVEADLEADSGQDDEK